MYNMCFFLTYKYFKYSNKLFVIQYNLFKKTNKINLFGYYEKLKKKRCLVYHVI